MEIIQEIGSYAGLGAILGLAVLAALYFSQARDVKRLREWAGRAPERTVEQTGVQRVTPVPKRPTPAQPARPAAPGAPAAKPAAAQAAAAGAAPATAQGPAAATPAAQTGQGVPAAAKAAAAGEQAEAKEGEPEKAGAEAEKEPAAAAAEPEAAGVAAGPQPATAAAGAGQAGGEGPAGPTAQAGPAAPEKPTPPAEAPGDGAPAPPAPAPSGGPAPSGAPPTPPSGAPPIPAGPGRPPRRPRVPVRPGEGRRPAPSQTAILPPRSDGRERRPPWYRRVLSSPRYLVLVLAGILIVGGATAFGVVELTRDEGGGQGPRGQVGPGDGDDRQEPRRRARVNPASVTVSVLNGTTVPGLAAQIGDKVEGFGFQLGNITNSSDQQRAESVVMHAPGAERDAAAVGRRLGITQREPIDPDSQALGGDATVVVIAGQDQTQ
jgi:LytR cell envelope-related transcriptional attenuator